MSKKFASIRNAVAICLALCMPCQTVFVAGCICTSECPCQSNVTPRCECESQCNTLICSGCVCCSCDSTQPQGKPCSCKCRQLPLSGLPLSQQNTRSLSETLQLDSSFISCTTLNPLDLLRQITLRDTQNASCMVQQPCILFCRFLL